MSYDLRSVLAPYDNQRVLVVGFYDYSNQLQDSRGRPNKTSLVQDIIVTTPDGKELAVGHMWIQYAVTIWAARPMRGSKISFSARVSTYTKRLTTPGEDGLMTQITYSLSNPDEVEILEGGAEPKKEREYSMPVPPPVVQPPAVNLMDMLRLARGLADKIGPDTARRVAPHLSELLALSVQVGGPDQLGELFTLIGGQ